MLFADTITGCCPRFDPAPWDKKLVAWGDRLFLHDHVKSFFHIPLNFDSVVAWDMQRIASFDALPQIPLMLSDENSLWGDEVYIEVTKPIPDAHIVRLAGTYLTLARKGPMKNIGSWINDLESFAASQQKIMKKLFYYYTTCPSCAKKYGENYLVLLAEV